MSEEQFGLCLLEGRTFLSVGGSVMTEIFTTGATPGIHATTTTTISPFSGPFTLTGRYGVPGHPHDVGATFEFKGGGTAASLGTVTMAGSISLPGLVLGGRATGQITITNSNGTVTLALRGRREAAFGPMPASVAYTITGGTGSYAGANGAGTVDVILAARGHKFALTFHPK